MKNVSALSLLFTSSILVLMIVGWSVAQSKKIATVPTPENSRALVSVANPEPIGPAGREMDKRMVASFRLSKQGRDYLGQSKYAVAEVYFRRALALYPRNLEATTGMAKILEMQGKPEAFDAYSQSFDDTQNHSSYSTFPSDVEALAHYGLLCDEHGQWRKAVQAYEQSRQRLSPRPQVELDEQFDPKVVDSLRLRAMLHVVRGIALNEESKTDEALSAYQEAVQADPNQPLAQFYFGRALQKVGRVDEAKIALGKAVRLGDGAVKVAAQKAIMKP